MRLKWFMFMFMLHMYKFVIFIYTYINNYLLKEKVYYKTKLYYYSKITQLGFWFCTIYRLYCMIYQIYAMYVVYAIIYFQVVFFFNLQLKYKAALRFMKRRKQRNCKHNFGEDFIMCCPVSHLHQISRQKSENLNLLFSIES